jgi:flagellum-specific ATP synthase
MPGCESRVLSEEGAGPRTRKRRRVQLLERTGECVGRLGQVTPLSLQGRIHGIGGLAIEIAGLQGHVWVGDRVAVQTRAGQELMAEIVAFRKGMANAVPFGVLEGLGPVGTARARVLRSPGSTWPPPATRANSTTLAVSDAWLGRVLDPLGRPFDDAGPLLPGFPRPVRASPPDATSRAKLGERIDLGVRVLNMFATCRRGQRLGLFAGSGVGKSTLLAMLARHTACDVAVLALVGERGREVREFIEDDLGPDGLARSVVVIATSDAPPMLRREAAYTAMTVAEHFRDQGKSVLLLVDSITRFCLAAREIGLSAGEPPATRGYPPSVFAELPRLLERAGPGVRGKMDASGCITAFFTVLVEGDDHNEPVADAVRGILDGHVVLDRKIAESGRYPAVDALRSLSRAVPACLSEAEAQIVQRARAVLALHSEMADMVRLGAYRPGSDPAIDEAIVVAPRIERLLRQGRNEFASLGSGFAALDEALNGR